MKSPRSVPPRVRGFSLLELTATLAATAVIGAVVASAYRTYTVRAQIAASVALAVSVQNHVIEAFKATGILPIDRHAAGLSSRINNIAGDYVESIDVTDGRIEIDFGGKADPAIAGRVLSLTPFESVDNQVVWICGNKIPGVGLNPLGFAGGGRQAVQVLTTIEARYLPSTCR